jgi:hypothetical protein
LLWRITCLIIPILQVLKYSGTLNYFNDTSELQHLHLM